MKYLGSISFLLLGLTKALPTDLVPGITFASSSLSSCDNGTANTIVKTVDSETGSYQMIHTLDNFEPAQEQEQVQLCLVEYSIGIPSGYRARANKDGINVTGYVHLPNAHTSADFTGSYSFASDPKSVSTSTLLLTGPIDGQFSKWLDPNEQSRVVKSSCDGDVLKSLYELKSTSSDLAEMKAVGEPDNKKWVIAGGVEILKC
ncbi:hypothetical protein BDV96DRAFT_633161 [Lophiotrema nucula]|uniref:Uncharacterized protein n=1 Tax=Lophiotrema nucula TaxID=690887 RepID=A0A6A5Z2G3_9PLEO|nr:hypothetical protein BDV96DRAFT_633161 [Lophiotrema nucula]